MRRIFFMRKDLNMPPGKLASHVGYCTEEYWTCMLKSCSETGYRTATDGNEYKLISDLAIQRDMYDGYMCSSLVKTIYEAKNKSDLLEVIRRANDLSLENDFDFGVIYDKCPTLEPEEDDGTTLTGIWFGPLPDDVTRQISEGFQLYK